MGQIFAVADADGHSHRCYGCIYGWVSEFIPELSGHWIRVSRSSGLFWVWLTLKLFYGILPGKLALELDYGSPFARPTHLYVFFLCPVSV